MTEPPPGRTNDFSRFWIVAILAAALIAGTVAAVNHSREHDQVVPALEDLQPRGGSASRYSETEAPDIEVNLPEVPNLETEPPPPRPENDDPRFAQLESEMRIMSRAREQLGEHPRAALVTLAQHREIYPEGILSEQRAAYEIEALVRLERGSDAERRYYDFVSRYPESEHREGLRELLD